MPTVANLLSKSLFKNFRLVSGRNGLNNNVTSAGFFEWEQGFQITKYFDKGEFVVTTISSLKDDINAIEKSLKLLINNNVSAIAIKDIYYDDISDNLKNYSDIHGVPILFFTDTYIDEILYAVKNETLNNLYTSFNEIVLDTLMSDINLSSLEKENLLRKINPFFYSSSMICAYISNDTDTDSISQDSLDLYSNFFSTNKIEFPQTLGNMEFSYSFTAYKRGVFLIATCNTSEDDILSEFKAQLISTFKSDKTLNRQCIGISNYIHGFHDIKNMLLDAIFANTACILNKKNLTEISSIGFDYIVFKNCYAQSSNTYFEQIMRSLAGTNVQRAPLLETLLVFVSFNGNIDATAQKMYQHKNTIRYRINKLKTIFSADNDIEFHGKLYFFSRLYFAKQYLDVFSKSDRQ